VIGPGHSLRLQKGEVTGSAFGRGVRLELTPERIDGHLGGRRVRLDVQLERGALDLWGTWADASADLVAEDDRIVVHGGCCGQYQFVRQDPTADEVGNVVFESDLRQERLRHRLLIPEPLLARLSAPETGLLLLFLVGGAGGRGGVVGPGGPSIVPGRRRRGG
jgi:hypothetical protein